MRRSLSGSVRRRWHLLLGHHVIGTVVRDMRPVGSRFEFLFRNGWLCINCRRDWPV